MNGLHRLYSRPAYEEVLIFSPQVATGGPEALHQLQAAIRELGGASRMVYVNLPFSVQIENGHLLCEMQDGVPVRDTYARYRPVALRESVPVANRLLVFPEVQTHQIFEYGLAQQTNVAVWWLSVDNALGANPALHDEAYRRGLFGVTAITHFYQSAYACHFLNNAGARKAVPLYDYTDEDFITAYADEWAALRAAQRGRTVAYFPAKGAELAARFRASAEQFGVELDFIEIANMSKAQVREALSRAAVYIDFGHHPGKDRVPREAAITGAVVMLHDTGAARYFDDQPLETDYLFTGDNIDDGKAFFDPRE